ncbi:unnamed protein product, partial [Thlaspi arvense]
SDEDQEIDHKSLNNLMRCESNEEANVNSKSSLGQHFGVDEGIKQLQLVVKKEKQGDVAGLQEAAGTRFSQFELIGRGSFGDVYNGECHRTHFMCLPYSYDELLPLFIRFDTDLNKEKNQGLTGAIETRKQGTAVITGASFGLGLATAKLLADKLKFQIQH